MFILYAAAVRGKSLRLLKVSKVAFGTSDFRASSPENGGVECKQQLQATMAVANISVDADSDAGDDTAVNADDDIGVDTASDGSG